MLVFLTTSEDALEVYKALKESLPTTGLQLRSSIPAQAQDLGSAALQRVSHSFSIDLPYFWQH